MGRLFVVATPIGNLEDITLRALKVLKEVDVIFCESLKKARILLGHFGIKKRLVVLNVKNERKRVKELVDWLKKGDVALITDSGTPGISDPGYLPVKTALSYGFEVVPIPGPSSVTALLSISGLPTERFYFEGFLPNREKRKEKRLNYLLSLDSTFVFFESPHRIVKTFELLNRMAPERPVAVGRELTKMHEEVLRGTCREIFETLKDRKILGEFVVAVAPEGYGKI